MSTGLPVRVVVVDDEPYICEIVAEALTAEGFSVTTFSDPEEGIAYIQQHEVDLVLSDLLMPTRSGVQVLEATKNVHSDIIFVLMTAHPTVETAIKALTQGAYDFLVKPFKLEVLKATVARGLSHQQIIRDNLNLRAQVDFLKAANASEVHLRLDDYFRSVLNSCMIELEAVSATIIRVDPDTFQVEQVTTHEAPSGILPREVTEQMLRELAARQQPGVRVRRHAINRDGQQLYEVVLLKPLQANGQLRGLIHVRIESRFGRVTPGQLDVLTILGNAVTAALTSFKLYSDLRTSYLQAIRALAKAIEARDPYTSGHTDRVLKLAELVARELGWDEARIEHLIVGCTLHDIGKIGVPDSVLNKTGALSDEERLLMMRHPTVGLKIVSGIDLLKPAISYIISHHERYDGAGYPYGLKGEKIPIEGRLLAVVDTFDAIVSDRPYRKGAPLENALQEILANSGTQFDPTIVRYFVSAMKRYGTDFEELYGRALDMGGLNQLELIETESA